MKIAKFNIGDLVIHTRSRYRAIIVDIDPLFQASGNYNPQAIKHKFATRNPWYRILVDESEQVCYVEESLLIADPCDDPIINPRILNYLKEHSTGYRSNRIRH